nr:unnamed protein product [Spirometra erinaceieuropaei]
MSFHKLDCLWPLPAGQRGSCRFRRANHRRLEKVAIEGSDGRLEVPTIGEANQERHGRKTESAGGRYWPVIEGAVDCGKPTMDDWRSQPWKARREDCACSRYCPVIEGADDGGEPTMDDWECQP